MKIIRDEERGPFWIITLWMVLTVIGGVAWASHTPVGVLVVGFYIVMGAAGIISIGKWIIDTW